MATSRYSSSVPAGWTRPLFSVRTLAAASPSLLPRYCPLASARILWSPATFKIFRTSFKPPCRPLTHVSFHLALFRSFPSLSHSALYLSFIVIHRGLAHFYR